LVAWDRRVAWRPVAEYIRFAPTWSELGRSALELIFVGYQRRWAELGTSDLELSLAAFSEQSPIQFGHIF
jgi:hypothetical protein